MKKILLTVIPVLILAVSFMAGGCGTNSDDAVVAKVNGDKIYAKELNEIYQNNQLNFSSFDDELKNRMDVVDSMVIHQLLVQEAYKKKIDENDEINRIVLANQDRFLLDILYLRKIIDPVKVDENELKDYYNKLEFKVHASHILVDNKDTAQMILDSLKNGGNFEQLAVAYSIDPTAKQNRGDIGFFVWGQLDEVFSENLWKLNPGEMTEPFETRYGWHIARCIDRQPNELRSTYGKMKDQIKQALEVQRRKEIQTKYLDELSDKYKITVDTVTLQYLQHKRESLYPPSLLATLPNNDFDPNQLDGHERELVLASWDGGQITLGQYLGMIKRLPASRKPDFNDHEKMGDIIFQLELNNILGTEARKLGLMDDPEYKRKIKMFKEIAMADVMQSDSIPTLGPPDEGEIRQYYEENPGEFLVPEKMHIYEIQFNDYSTANGYVNKIGSLTRFQNLAAQYTQRPGMRNKKGDLGWIQYSQYPTLFKAAKDGGLNKTIGPVQNGNKYSLIWVEEDQPEQVKDFLQVKTQIYDKLNENRKRKSFEDWVAKKKAESDIEISENNIRATIDKSKYEDTSSGE